MLNSQAVDLKGKSHLNRQILHGKDDYPVIHQAASRDGDGGVDLYAVDESGQSWIVQCKCWAAHRSVGPEIVRELHGAIAFADRGSSGTSKGIVITTSRFTSGAAEVGREFGF